jgi:uncharacterized protein (TIGR02996 family)
MAGLTATLDEVFLRDIIDSPDDDAPRLIYADHLEERGEQARSAFIRVQCELARMGNPFSEAADSRYDILRRRERELLRRHVQDWIPPVSRLAVWTHFAAGREPQYGWLDKPRGAGGTSLPVTFRRGFVAEITCHLADWCGGRCPAEGCVHGMITSERGEGFRCPACLGTGHAPGHGPALVRAAPLEYVTLSDREPFAYTAGGRPTYLWRCVENGFGGERNLLPVALFDFLPGHERGQVAEYAASADAVDALSQACLAWANAEADRAAR